MSDLKQASFWVGQLCIIVATVLGVFLAASQGFKQAMMFDDATTTQSNYYLRKSLSGELAANLGHIEVFADKVARQVDKPELVLDTFVWESMTYSRNALETPSDLLAEAQNFYRTVNEIMTTSYYNNTKRVELLRELSAHIKDNVLPRFERDMEGLRQKLGGYNLQVS